MKIKKTGLVLVDFYADWCAPCQRFFKIWPRLADEIGDKVELVKINSDENPDLVAEYGVEGVPAFFLYKDGTIVYSWRRFKTLEEIKQLVNEFSE